MLRRCDSCVRFLHLKLKFSHDDYTNYPFNFYVKYSRVTDYIFLKVFLEFKELNNG